jgi:arylsulfatase A-like enzyme
MNISRRSFLGIAGAGATMAVVPRVMAQVIAPKRLIIFGWDGVGLNTLNRVRNNGGTPNLNDLINSNGIYPMQLVTASMTIPSWASIFTGLDPHQHGSWGNVHHDSPDLVWDQAHLITYNSGTKQYNAVRWWSNPLIWEQSMFSGMNLIPTKIGWIVSKKYLNNDAVESPFIGIWNKIKAYGWTVKYHSPAPAGDGYLDQLTSDAMSFLQRQYTYGNSFVLFVHANPDNYGHLYGETGQRYEEEISRCDAVLGQFMLAKSADTKVMVITDHGFDPGKFGHSNAYDAWMTTDLPIALQWSNSGVTNLDITPTVREWYGLGWQDYFRHGRSLLA